MEVNIIILYISIISFTISLVFLLVQGAYNCAFLNSSSRKNIIERLLFEQFSYEVYSSINITLSYYFPLIQSSSSECLDEMRFTLNLDIYYDCRGIFTIDLDSQCRDKIIRNTTSCSNAIDPNSFSPNDPRIRYCIYFSNYTQPITILNGKTICKSETKINYEKLLSNSLPLYDLEGKPNSCDENEFINCGILDTMNNILCFPKYSGVKCPFYKFTSSEETIELESANSFNSKIIVSVIISENQPLNHEWDTIVRSLNEKLSEKNIYKRKTISPADFKLFDEEYDNTYEKQEGVEIKVEKIIEENNLLPKDYNQAQTLSIYTRNYIGFKNIKELKKFQKYFKQSNNRDNPLFRLSSSSHHNPIITIVFSGVFLILSILYGIFSFIQLIDQKNYFKIFFAIIILYFIGNLIIIIYHSVKCPLIHIEMDQRMKKVLDAYNKRTIMFQLFRYIGTFFNLASFVLAIIFNFKEEQQGGNPLSQQDNQHSE